MKTAGILGGLGPESTIEYYRAIIAAYRLRKTDGSYPSFVVNSVNMTTVINLVTAGKLPELTEFLLSGLQVLGNAGADFGAIAANTPHVVFEAVRRRSPVPLISIVETTCHAAQALGLKRVGLFGTRFTMQGRFYHDVFAKAGITIVAPAASDQDYLHEKYMGELVKGIILPETREAMMAIVGRLKADEGIEALILGGTELPLILGKATFPGVEFLDTTVLHVEQIVSQMLS
jgi:aspartate racemase